LPVGVVTSISEEGVRVVPYADATNIEYVRLMDYGLEGILDDSDDDDLAAGGMSRSTKRGRR
jgi:rod shape-determining protein MreC